MEPGCSEAERLPAIVKTPDVCDIAAPEMAAASRRRFVQGLAAATVGLGAPDWPRAQEAAAGPVTLSGDSFDLTIASAPIDITGRRRLATTINGSVPAPTLRLREGDTVTIKVTNRLAAPTSLHWHGLRLPADMDGVPGLSFKGVMPGETFTYRFPVIQTGTYWYHGHSGMQDQTGLYGALILEPRAVRALAHDRDHVVLLSDWTDENSMDVLSNLKMQGDYYNFHQRTMATFAGDARRKGLGPTWRDWTMWGGMRMSPTDIMDVTGATYTFLVNGRPPAANWTALFEPGERVRLRFINGSAMTTFDVRIPGLPLLVVAADGGDVEPVEVDQFRIGAGETYDVIVHTTSAASAAHTIFAQAEDRSGYARATLATRAGLAGMVPEMDPHPLRTMADMGMAAMPMDAPKMGGASMAGMDMGGHDMAAMGSASGVETRSANAEHIDPAKLQGAVNVDNVAREPRDRQAEAGAGLDGDGRRTLVYADLKALRPDVDARPPDREI